MERDAHPLRTLAQPPLDLDRQRGQEAPHAEARDAIVRIFQEGILAAREAVADLDAILIEHDLAPVGIQQRTEVADRGDGAEHAHDRAADDPENAGFQQHRRAKRQQRKTDRRATQDAATRIVERDRQTQGRRIMRWLCRPAGVVHGPFPDHAQSVARVEREPTSPLYSSRD